MKLTPEEIARLAKKTVEARPAYINCEDWLHMVGEYVEAQGSEEKLMTERMLMVRQHAQDCPDCQIELELLQGLVDQNRTQDGA